MKNNNLYFIIEEAYTPADKPQIIKDTKIGDGKYKLIFRTILQEADVPNNNNRIYPKSVLQNVVSQLKPKAVNRELLGELDHPWVESSDINLVKKRAGQVRLSDSCVLFRDITFDGKYVIAECETLTTSKGLDLYALLKDGVNIGFSLRAFGPVAPGPDGKIIVKDNIKAITYDVVSNPSHSSARILEFMQEDINLFIPPADSLIMESVDSDNIKTENIIFVPYGSIVNDLDDDELEQLKQNDNIEIHTITVKLDSSTNTATICNDNICIQKPLDEFIDILMGRGRINRIYNNQQCDFYPLVGYGRLLKMGLIDPSTYRPIFDIDISSIVENVLNKNFNLNEEKNIEKSKNYTVEELYDETISKLLSEDIEFVTNILEESTNDDSNLDIESKIDEILLSVYKYTAELDNKELNEHTITDYLIEDTFDYVVLPESNISLDENTNNNDIDWIDDEIFEFTKSPAFLSVSELIDFLDREYEEKLKDELNEEKIISQLNESIDAAVIELSSIPSILEEIYLEDEKYSIDTDKEITELSSKIEENHIFESKLDIILNHLLEDDFARLQKNLTNIVPTIYEIAYIDSLYFDN